MKLYNSHDYIEEKVNHTLETIIDNSLIGNKTRGTLYFPYCVILWGIVLSKIKK